jgi:geranylgeranyl diphosphate synthase type I
MSWDPTGFRAALDETLDSFVTEQGDRLADLGSDAGRLVEAARSAVLGGKRFRAAFCWWGFHAVRDGELGPADREALLRACAALELLHASALVHDDVMDASDTRRGQPSTHKAFEALHEKHGWSGAPEPYGAAAAILLGDLLLVWSDELMRTCGLPDAQVHEALGWFDRTRSEVIAGQFLDVSVQARGSADVDQAMRVLRYKSAKYSIERPLNVGAALAGGTAATIEALSGFGLPLGEAFQLRDDQLGVFGDPEQTGKPAGDDLAEGKRTVLVALALKALAKTSPQDGARLEAQLGRPLSGAEVDELRALIRASGADTRVEERIAALTDQALAALDRAGIDGTAHAVLRDLATAATQRAL